MRALGGFFDLELPEGSGGHHAAAHGLSTGRACLALFVREERPTRVHVPFYCCDALFAPFVEAGVPYEFYAVDERLDPVELPDLGAGEWYLYTNFFGLRSATVDRLRERYGERLVVDDTHRFFHRGYPGLWSFTSARKVFGVPDGAYCYAPRPVATADLPRHGVASVEHLVARASGRDDEAFALYRASEERLGSALERMSSLSERLLAGVDYERAAARRRENFAFLAEALDGRNRFAPAVGFDPEDDVPFCYPLLTDPVVPAERYHAERFFVPSLWLDTRRRDEPGFELERRLSADLRPLPIDHRYRPDDLERLVAFVREHA